MKMPSTAPTTIARVKPAPDRHSEAAPLLTSSPSLSISIQAAATVLSGGKASVETSPVRAPTPTRARARAAGGIAAAPLSCGAASREMLRSLPARSWRPPRLRFDRFDAHQVPDLVDLVDEALVPKDRRIALVELGIDDRLDAAGARGHHRHAVGEIDRLLHVVGHEDHGLRRALPDAEQLGLHEAAGLGIERAERLVHQQDFRVEGERARNRGALAHPAGKLRRIAVLEAGQPDQIDEGLRPLPAFVAREPHALQAVEDVGAHRLPRKQREMLKDDAAIGTRRADQLALDENLAGFRGEKAADEIEQRRLAAAGGSEQRDEFTPVHVERYVLEREHRPPAGWAIAMAHACDGDLRLRHGPQPLPAAFDGPAS